MRKTVKRVLYNFKPGENKLVIDYKEHTVESEESFIPIFVDSVKHTWYTLDNENIIEARIDGVLF